MVLFSPLLRLERLFRRFGRARKGTAAVEFALVAVPFFLLMVGIAEVSMVGLAQTSLDFSVSEVGRQIRTGQAQLNGRSASQMQQMLCSQMSSFLFLTCSGNLYLDVDTFTSFTDASNNNSSPISNNQFQTAGFGYSPGCPSDIVVVRAYYRWKILTPMFASVFQNVSGGERILVSTMMFRDEPYLVAGSGSC